MSSMFDDLTVSAPALGADTPGGIGYIGPRSSTPLLAPTQAPVAGLSAGSGYQAPVTAVAPSVSVGYTGLIAKVEGSEFLKLVGSAGGVMVLFTAQTKSGSQKLSTDRYVASIGGIIFIAHSSSALRFPSGVVVVATSAVLCEGRPLSSEDYM